MHHLQFPHNASHCSQNYLYNLSRNAVSMSSATMWQPWELGNHTNNGSSDGFETLWRTLSKAKAIAPQDTKPKNATTGVLTLGTNSTSFLAFLTGFFVFLRILAFLLFFFDGFVFFAAFLLAFAAFFAFAAAAFFALAAFFCFR